MPEPEQFIAKPGSLYRKTPDVRTMRPARVNFRFALHRDIPGLAVRHIPACLLCPVILPYTALSVVSAQSLEFGYAM